MEPTLLTIIIRFLVTFILSLLFGLERHKAHKPIGFGTFIFVAIGSCGLAITAMAISIDNPLPLLAAIVTGIGFLGAGALIRTTDKIFGFTTAASIWVFAIFGLVIGAGEYLIGIIMYALIWAVILFDRHLEKKGVGSYQKKIIIHTKKIVDEKEITNQLLVHTDKYKLIHIKADKINNMLSLTYLIEVTKQEINKIPKLLYEKDWFASCEVE